MTKYQSPEEKRIVFLNAAVDINDGIQELPHL